MSTLINYFSIFSLTLTLIFQINKIFIFIFIFIFISIFSLVNKFFHHIVEISNYILVLLDYLLGLIVFYLQFLFKSLNLSLFLYQLISIKV